MHDMQEKQQTCPMRVRKCSPHDDAESNTCCFAHTHDKHAFLFVAATSYFEMTGNHKQTAKAGLPHAYEGSAGP